MVHPTDAPLLELQIRHRRMQCREGAVPLQCLQGCARRGLQWAFVEGEPLLSPQRWGPTCNGLKGLPLFSDGEMRGGRFGVGKTGVIYGRDDPIFEYSVFLMTCPSVTNIYHWSNSLHYRVTTWLSSIPATSAMPRLCPCRLCSASVAVTRDTTNSQGFAPPFECAWSSPRICFVVGWCWL